MIVNCTYCNKEINKKESEIKKNKRHFCSNKCKNKWESENLKGKNSPHYNRVKVKCDYCHVEIEIEKAKYNKLISGKQKNVFCNRDCRANWEKINKKGKLNPLFKKTNNRCEYCNKEYLLKQSKINSSKYCSIECMNNARKINIELNCEWCNKKFYKIPSMIREHNFCSKDCSNNWTSKYKNNKVNINCIICGKEYFVSNNRKDFSITCSIKCLNVWKSKIYPKTENGKIHLVNGGINSMLSQKYQDTKPELMTKHYLDNNNIKYISQHPMYNKFVVDFYLPDKNIVLEILGDYWHGNPIKYGNDEGLKPLSEKQIKQQNKDKLKFLYLTKCGHNVYMIWENDIYKNINFALSFLN